MRRIAMWVAVLSVGCAADVGVEGDEIVDGSPATTWMMHRTVSLPNCTGTLISPNHVLTAAHCEGIEDWHGVGHSPEGFFRNDPVYAYAGTPFAPDYLNPRHVDSMTHPPGVVPDYPSDQYGDFTDDANLYDDITIVTLDAPFADSEHTEIATLAWQYAATTGYAVGRGMHDGEVNPFDSLLYATDYMVDTTDSDGSVRTALKPTNQGDSGGPFYTPSHQELGVLHGGPSTYSIYTSVPRHLPWILATIGWTWPNSVEANVTRQGAVQSSFVTPSSLVCQYACDRTTACRAYNYVNASGQCTLLSSVTGQTLSPSLLVLRTSGAKP